MSFPNRLEQQQPSDKPSENSNANPQLYQELDLGSFSSPRNFDASLESDGNSLSFGPADYGSFSATSGEAGLPNAGSGNVIGLPYGDGTPALPTNQPFLSTSGSTGGDASGLPYGDGTPAVPTNQPFLPTPGSTGGDVTGLPYGDGTPALPTNQPFLSDAGSTGVDVTGPDGALLGVGGGVAGRRDWRHGEHGAPNQRSIGGDILADKLVSDPALYQALQVAGSQMSAAGEAALMQSLGQSLMQNPYTPDNTILQTALTQMTNEGAPSSDLAAVQNAINSLSGSTSPGGTTDGGTTAPVAPPVTDTPTTPTTSPVTDTPTTPTTSPVTDTPTTPATPPVTDTPTTPATPPVTDTNGSPTGGGDSAAMGPGGPVGSTATAFGPSAMPEATPTGPVVTLQAGANIQDAINSNPAGTTFVLDGGTYNVSSPINLTSANSGDSFISASGSQPAVLDGGGQATTLMNIEGANNINVQGLTFENTVQVPQISGEWPGLYSNIGSNAITADQSTGDNFSYNAFNHVGDAMYLTQSQGMTIEGNDINNVDNAVYMYMYNQTSNAPNTISGNRITNVDNLAVDSTGALLIAEPDTTINNNLIENAQGMGMYIDANMSNDSITGNTLLNTNTAATWDNGVYNNNYPTDPSDSGAIYVWNNTSADKNLTISNNYIDGAGNGLDDKAIYLDNGTSGATITGNIMDEGGYGYDLGIGGVEGVSSSDVTIKNNIFNLSSPSGLVQGIFSTGSNNGDSITGNTFYSDTPTGVILSGDGNLSGKVSGNDYYGVNPPSQDTNPSTTNPNFTDPANGEY